jgi:hypothetical protein
MSTQANGLKKVTVYIRPDQYLSLRLQALDAAMAAGGHSDISKILRAAIDVHLDASTVEPGRNGRQRTKASLRPTRR